MGLNFTRDRQKASSNLAKHGVSFEDAAIVFADPLARIFDNPNHSDQEQREIIIGHSAEQKLLMITMSATSIRILSARKATKRERRDYEENVGS